MMRMRGWFVLFILAITLQARAGGDSVGHGGVLWACRGVSGGQVFYSGVLTDLFEARILHGWTVISSSETDPLKIYEGRKAWLKGALPEFYEVLKPRFDYVEEHRHFVDAELMPTNDYVNVVKPDAALCPQGQWQPLNIANFREQDQEILISRGLWNSSLVPSLDKAALLFHEAIYFWMRTYYGSTTSDKARILTGLLFSSKPPAEIKEEVVKTLGNYPDRPDGKFICTMKNTRRDQMYVAFAGTVDDASLEVRLRCQNDPGYEDCADGSLLCDEIPEPPKKARCLARNLTSHQLYVGRGRVELEAQFNAYMACYVGSMAQGYSDHTCPELTFMDCQSN